MNEFDFPEDFDMEAEFSGIESANTGDDFSESYFGTSNDEFVQSTEGGFLSGLGKFAIKALPTIGAIGGGVAGEGAGMIGGGMAGAALGTALIPVPIAGTVLGGGIGALAGGALGLIGGSSAGTFTGKTLQENLENLFYRTDEEDISQGEIFDRAKDEATVDAAFTTGVLAGGKILKGASKIALPPLKAGASKVAAPIIKLEGVQNVIRETDKAIMVLGQKVGSLKETIGIKASDAFKSQAKKVAEKSSKIKETISFLDDTISKEVDSILAPMSKATRVAYKNLKGQYSAFYKQYGDEVVDLVEETSALDELVARFGDDIMQSGASSKLGSINTILKNSAESGEPITFREAVKLKQSLSDVWMDIVSKGSSRAKSEMGQPVREIINSLDKTLLDGTSGSPEAVKALKGLNSRYMEVMDVYGNSKSIANMFGKKGAATNRNFIASQEQGIESFIGQATKRGEKFFGYKTREEMLSAMAKGDRKVFKGLAGNSRAIVNQSFALRQTGVPKLVAIADKMDAGLMNIAEASVSRVNLETTLKGLKGAEKLIGDVAVDEKALLKQIEKELAENAMERESLKLTTSELLQNSKVGSLLGLWIAGDAASQASNAIGLPPAVGRSIKTVTMLAAIGKWSPSAAKVTQQSLVNLEKTLAGSVLKPVQKVAIAQLLKEITALSNE